MTDSELKATQPAKMIDVITLRLFGEFEKTQCSSIFLFYLLLISTSSLAQQVGKKCNSTSQYFNDTLNACVSCTDCSARGLGTYTNCTATTDAVCHCPEDHYFSRATRECEPCSQCERVKSQCTPLNDTVCYQCGVTESYDSEMDACVTDCLKCPYGCLLNQSVCACEPGVEYFYESSCSLCTVCPSYQQKLENCSATKDTVCGIICPDNQYLDVESGECITCRTCTTDSAIKKRCTRTSDTECCEPKYFYNTAAYECTPDCDQCPLGCKNHRQCRCSDDCHTGPLCDILVPNCAVTESPTDPPITEGRTPGSSAGTMNPISSALIAVGAVIGIIIFSALFVLLGVFTSCNRGGTSSQNDSSSNNSTDHFLYNGKVSASLASLYGNGQSPLPYQEYRTSLDILRLSGSGGSLSDSFRSPIGSPKPKRPSSTPLTNVCKHRDNNWTPV